MIECGTTELSTNFKRWASLEKLLDWFRNYLSGRKQKVVINGTSSNWRTISAGVPQGSILGPLIFLVYINDLADNIDTNIRLYADDASLYITYENANDAATILNEDLSKVQTWANRWLMTFNPSKTESLTFSR